MPLHRLSDMELDFVSLVAAGDDPEAKVMIAKAAPEGRELTVPNAGNLTGMDLIRHLAEKARAKRKKQPVDKSEGDVVASPTLRVTDLSKENPMGTTISKADLPPEVVQYIDGLEQEVTDLSAQVEKNETDLTAKDEQIAGLTAVVEKSAPKDADAAAEIRKSVLAKADPAVRALIEEQDERIAKAEATANAEREARISKDFISKASTLPMLGTDREGLAVVLRKASDALDAETFLALDTVLKAANAQIAESNLFGTIGSDLGDSVINKGVESAVEAIQKADPTLTKEQATARAYAENPSLLASDMSGKV